MSKVLKEKVASDDGISSIVDPVTPEGGDPDFTVDGSDIQAKKTVKESIDELFEGEDLSENFKGKASLVFEAAVNETVRDRLDEAKEEFNEALEEATATIEEQMQTELSETVDGIVEQLDSYLDYVIKEWITENKLAIEAGVKVEMAESLMSGLRGLFEDHNIDVSDETVDIVASLEEEVADAKDAANKAIQESIKLTEQVSELKAVQVFTEISEGLTTSQVDRFTTLAENLDYSNISKFSTDLKSLKETFFKREEAVLAEHAGEQTFIEEAPRARKMISEDHDVSAIAAALALVKK